MSTSTRFRLSSSRVRSALFALALSLAGSVHGLGARAAAQACEPLSELANDLINARGRWVSINNQTGPALQFVRSVRGGCITVSLITSDQGAIAVYDLVQRDDGTLALYVDDDALTFTPVSIGGMSLRVEAWRDGNMDVPESSEIWAHDPR